VNPRTSLINARLDLGHGVRGVDVLSPYIDITYSTWALALRGRRGEDSAGRSVLAGHFSRTKAETLTRPGCQSPEVSSFWRRETCSIPLAELLAARREMRGRLR